MVSIKILYRHNIGHYYLQPLTKGHGREIIKCLLCVRASVCLCVSLSRFHINLNMSLIYKDIFTKYAGNVYGYKNLSVQNFGLILKNEMAAIGVEFDL